MKAIILAGGKGARLKPFTETLPKPMLPIGAKPLLEILIQHLKQFGFKEVILAIYYLGDNIVHYFEDGKRVGINIYYSKEKSLLGTAGAIKNASKYLDETFVMILGDGLADIDYTDLIRYHRKNKSMATMVVFEKNIKVPYGVLNIDINKDNVILNMHEKPNLTFNINTGICVLEPQCLNYIDQSEFLSITDFFLRLMNVGEKVIAYYHKGTWIDIGQNIEQYIEINQEIINKKITFNRTLSDIIFGKERI